jgi:hypothetical protein
VEKSAALLPRGHGGRMMLMKNLGRQIVEVKKQGTTCLRSGSVLDEVLTPAHVHPVSPDFRRAEDDDTPYSIQGHKAKLGLF